MSRETVLLGARWLVTIVVVALLSLWILDLHNPRMPDELLRIDEARFVESASTTPPVSRSDEERVALPDDWAARRVGAREGWYRVELPLNVPPNRLWAVYLPSVNMNAAVYLNGELLGSGGQFEEPVARNWNRPLYFAVPNGLLRSGTNTIHVRMKAQSTRFGLLGTVYLGPAEVLRPIYDKRNFLRQTLSEVIVVLLFVVGLFMAVLWYRRRHDTLYLWFAVAMWIWGLHNVNLIILDLPLPARIWEWANFVTLYWFPIAATIFDHRFLGIYRPRLETGLYIAGIVGSIALALTGGELFYWAGTRLMNTATLTFGLYPVVLLFLHFWRSARLDVLILHMAGLLLLVFGTHDLLVANHVISREDGFFLHFSAPFILAAFGVILLRRFVDALNESESLNQELEQRIDAKSRELAKNYDRLRALERERVLAEERGRIMREMHDGMGGHLVSTLALVEGERTDPASVRQALQTALDDMRLMIDSMDDIGGDLLGVLGMFRDRIEPRLRHGGIALRWQVRPLPRIANLGPQAALHVMRILQEAVTNIIKHAHASAITVRTAVESDGGVVVELCDDGRGLGEVAPRGRGLNNMQHRADALGGRVSVSSAEGGTCVRLWIPLDAGPGDAPDTTTTGQPPAL